MQEQGLIEKIRKLTPEKQAEVEDFVDFLSVRDEDRRFDPCGRETLRRRLPGNLAE